MNHVRGKFQATTCLASGLGIRDQHVLLLFEGCHRVQYFNSSTTNPRVQESQLQLVILALLRRLSSCPRRTDCSSSAPAGCIDTQLLSYREQAGILIVHADHTLGNTCMLHVTAGDSCRYLARHHGNLTESSCGPSS